LALHPKELVHNMIISKNFDGRLLLDEEDGHGYWVLGQNIDDADRLSIWGAIHEPRVMIPRNWFIA
jgi:hypothetical protein